MRPERIRGATAGAGIIVTTTVLLIGVLSLAYGYFQESALPFVAGLAVIAIGVVSGTLQVAVLPKRSPKS